MAYFDKKKANIIIRDTGNIFTNFLKFILIIIFLFACIGGLFAGVMSYISFDLPDVKQLEKYVPAVHSQILSRDGEVLLSVGKEKREMIKFKEIPKFVIDAFLSSEDNNFYKHKGIDFLGIVRALVMDVKAGKIVQGGSTITQQVAKSLLLSREKSFTRKIKDMLLAQEIEKAFTKDEILTLYLNHVYFGGGYYGIKAAFRGYFGKEIKDGTVAEAAMLAGLLVAPGRYSPYLNPGHAKVRQKYVIGRMYEDKRITKEQHEKALKEDLKIKINANEELKAGHFTDWVRQRVINLVGEEEFLTQGFKVVTTLDWDLQKVAEESIRLGVRELDKRQGFKGPLKSLTREEDVKQFVIKSRRDFFEKNSAYFIIKPSGEKTYEIDFNENDYLKLVKEWEMSLAGKDQKHFWPGVGFYPDKIQNHLKAGDTYEGIVEKISDQQKLVFVSFLGTKGVITQQYYRWAHKRKISENTTYIYNYVNNPSEILKKGDVIKVKLLDNKTKSLWDNVADDYKKRSKGIISEKIINDLKKERFYSLELDQEPEAEGAQLALNANNGQILSMVGGVDFNKSQFNRAIQSSRQPGSSFKPIIYAVALENGYTPATIIMDSPEALTGQDDLSAWKPKNYDGEFEGPITFRRALETSRNVPTIRIALDIGVKKIIDFAGRVGMDASSIDKDLSLALGSFGVNLLNLVSSYAIFPNAGKRVIPKSIISIIDRNGKSYYLDEISGHPGGINVVPTTTDNVNGTPIAPAPVAAISNTQDETSLENSFTANFDKYNVYDPRLAYIMTNLLKGVIQSGTAASARDLGPRVAGKTGTTNDYVDAWFVGFSHNVVSGVWTGFDSNKTIGYGETGGKAALPMWKDFMKKVLQKYGDQDFTPPKGVLYSWINKETGIPTQSDSANAFFEAFIDGTEPGTMKNDLFKIQKNSFNGKTGGSGSTGDASGKTNQGKNGKNNQLMDDDYYLHQ